MGLNSAERAELRQFLVSCFSLGELKDLAFDLEVDFQLLPHQTTVELARELLSYFERRDQLSCLVIEILRRRHNDEIAQLLSSLPPCWPGYRLQIVVENNLIDSVTEMLGELADKLNIRESEIALFGADWGGKVRLMGSMPEEGDRISIPLILGPIPAGSPMSAKSFGRETIEVPRGLLADSTDLQAFVARGSSLEDSLVHDGDVVILRGQEQVENGEMACVWLMDCGEIRLRRVYHEGEMVRLQPANPTLAPEIVAAEEVQNLGKVVMVIRG